LIVIVGATGHQNIPESAVPGIRQDIRRFLASYSTDLTGVCSLAPGADQLFAECVLEAKGRLHVIIPCERYETTFSTAETRNSYSALLNQAHSIEKLPHTQPSETAFLDAGKRVVDISDLLLAVWDGKQSRGRGGTADIVEYAAHAKRETRVLWPAGLVR
jgi:hypothetical protein